MSRNNEHLGRGMRFPMRRVGNDFEASEGPDLVYSGIPYILLTNSDGPDGQGEQPWDTGFGSNLRRLKYANLSGEALRQYTDEFVVDSLDANEPRVEVIDTVVTKRSSGPGGRRVDIEVLAGTIDQDTDQNNVYVQPDAGITLTLPY